MNHKIPFAYFITLRTYGTWLHGDAKESVDRTRNQFHSPKINHSAAFIEKMRNSMRESEFILTHSQAQSVKRSIIETCKNNQWELLAVHVRTNHVHLVVSARILIEELMQKLKTHATIALKKEHQNLNHRQRFWTRHASTKNIWLERSLFPVMYYVVKKQGEPFALYYNEKYYDKTDEMMYEAYYL